MKIAVVGAGSVGGALARRLAQAGHQVYFGVRNSQSGKTQQLVASIGANARAGTVAEAVAESSVVIFAPPWPAVAEALQSAGDLTGKILVDCTNPIQMGAGGLELTMGFNASGAEYIATLVPGAQVVKAFNSTGYANMEDPSVNGQRSVMFVCGDEASARATVCDLSEAIGFDTIDAGGLNISRLLEPLAMLWVHLAYTTDLTRDFAFAVLRR